jgi:hypothetical protein
MQIFQRVVGIYAAGRLMLTLCVLGLPFATLFFLRRASPGNEYLAIWAFVVAYNPDLLMGFMSFELSVALSLVVVGLWLDYLRTGKTATWFLTLILATLLFFTHLGGFAVAGLALTVYTLASSGISRRLLAAWGMFVPGGAFFLWAKFHGWAGRGLDYSTWHFAAKMRTMTTVIRGYSRPVTAVVMVALAITVIYFVLKRSKVKLQLPWLAVALSILAVHWIVPDKYGDLGFIDYRFSVFAFLFLLAVPVLRGPKQWLGMLATCVFLLRTFEVGSHFVSEQKRLMTLANDFDCIPRNALVLAYEPEEDGPWIERAALHFWAYGVIDKGWITPDLFHQKSVQPLLLRVPMYADDDLMGEKLQGRKYDIRTIGQKYDYIWSNDPHLERLLDKIGEPILVSADNFEIFKSRRAFMPSAFHVQPGQALH